MYIREFLKMYGAISVSFGCFEFLTCMIAFYKNNEIMAGFVIFSNIVLFIVIIGVSLGNTMREAVSTFMGQGKFLRAKKAAHLGLLYAALAG